MTKISDGVDDELRPVLNNIGVATKSLLVSVSHPQEAQNPVPKSLSFVGFYEWVLVKEEVQLQSGYQFFSMKKLGELVVGRGFSRIRQVGLCV
jgi:hypothetical protein